MKKDLKNALLAIVIVLVLISPKAASQETNMKNATITFAEKANRHSVSGFGGEWDPHFWRAPNVRRGCDEKAWSTVQDRIRSIGIARVRMMLMPDWYEPDNDNSDPAQTNRTAFTWDSEPMKSLYRHLDFCQETGIRVTLTWWCAPVKRQSDGAPYWLAFPNVKEWCSAPNDVAECAENVVAGLRYLLEERAYTCIDAFTFMNEPDWTFFNNDNVVDFDYYAKICRAIHEKLKAAGLRQHIELDLADDSMHRGWIKQSVDNLVGIGDRYNAHSYIFSCEDSGYPNAMRAWVRERVKQCGDKPFSTNELGTRHYQGAYTATDVETFERAFCVSQFAILGLNEGMTGALFWGLYDQYYYDGKNPVDGSNGGLMKTNLMAYVTDKWRIRPTGQAWTLICTGAPRQARVHPGSSDDTDVDAVALSLPHEAGTNILLVNRAKATRSVQLKGIPTNRHGVHTARITSFGRNGLKEPESREWTETSVLELPSETLVLICLKAAP